MIERVLALSYLMLCFFFFTELENSLILAGEENTKTYGVINSEVFIVKEIHQCYRLDLLVAGI